MNTNNFVFLLFHILSGCTINQVVALQSEGIINGVLASQSNHKYQAAIVGLRNSSSNFEIIGSGALIDNNYVLAAAHLFVDNEYELKPLTFYVRLGSSDLKSKDDNEIFIETFYFLSYDVKTGLDDLVLIKINKLTDIKSDPKFKKIPIASEGSKSQNDKEGIVSSHGMHNTLEAIDYKLRYAEAKITENSQCDNLSEDTDGQICIVMRTDKAGSPRGLCTLDAGAPFVVDNHLVAIASKHSENCDDTQIGSIYTDVRPFEKIIQAVIEGYLVSVRVLENNPRQA